MSGWFSKIGAYVLNVRKVIFAYGFDLRIVFKGLVDRTTSPRELKRMTSILCMEREIT
tara:strand:+ start:166 stop:339 length:174 start_codon:yes stop_codon:yes gene_type:complete